MVRQRRGQIAATTPQQLGIIVGLPRPMYQAAKAAAEKAFPRWKFVSTRFPDSHEIIYNYEQPFLAALEKACSFMSSQPSLPLPRPARLIVFYVVYGDIRLVLEAFGFAALLVPLEVPGWHWPKGRHWRGNPDVVLPLLLNKIVETENGNLGALRLKLERAAKDEPLLLPPRNFLLPDGRALTEHFDALVQSGMQDYHDLNSLASQRFSYENLKKYFQRVGGKNAVFRLDKRGLIFATGPQGQHGAVRQLNLAEISGLQEYRYALEGLFRFGTPLRPGFQHDVQWRDRNLDREEFWCNARRTKVLVSATHANIFANDRVR